MLKNPPIHTLSETRSLFIFRTTECNKEGYNGLDDMCKHRYYGNSGKCFHSGECVS